MDKALSILLLFSATGCASQARQAPYLPPESATSAVDLAQAIPPELFRGDLPGEYRGDADAQTAFLDYVFLKGEGADQVPMRVALYVKEGGQTGRLVRRFVADTPFAPGDCRRGECRARIASMPNGFQLSRESFGADRLRADYRFVRDGDDLRLIGKGFQARRPGGTGGREGTCTIFYDYEKGRVLRRSGGKVTTEPLPNPKPPRLRADQLRFETITPAQLCAPPAP